MDKQQFLAAARPAAHPVTIEGVGDIYIKDMTAGERLQLSGEDDQEIFERTVALCLCDENAQPLFGLDAVDEVKALRMEAVRAIASEAWRINGLAKEDVESAEKN